MDGEALARLGEARIDWRYKGFPARFEGRTVAELLAAAPPITDFGTPLMTLDADALAHNIAAMAAFCVQRGVDLAPHGKTTMAPQLFARQLAAGAWGITAATIAHVRAYRAFGVPTIVLANQLIDADSLSWVAAELGHDPGFRLLVFADSVAGVALMRRHLAGTTRPVDVVIDMGWPGARTGCRSVDEGLAVARAVRDAPGLRLVGVGGFEGALVGDRSGTALDTVRRYLGMVVTTIRSMDAEGLFESDEIIATAGGSAYFDDVVAGLAAIGPLRRPVRTVLRSGAYIAHDDDHYVHLTPLSGPGGFEAALRLRGRVLSVPEPGRALLDFGKRDAPMDLGLPIPLTLTRYAEPDLDGGSSVTGGREYPVRVAPVRGWTVTALADQHAFLRFPVGEDGPRVGDVVTAGISHPCTAFDKWRLIPVVDAGGTVVDLIRTYF